MNKQPSEADSRLDALTEEPFLFYIFFQPSFFPSINAHVQTLSQSSIFLSFLFLSHPLLMKDAEKGCNIKEGEYICCMWLNYLVHLFKATITSKLILNEI